MSHRSVSEIVTFPLKSAQGVALPESAVGKRGLTHDRCWALFGEDNQVLTARDYPQLLAIETVLTVDALEIHYLGSVALILPFEPAGSPPPQPLSVFRDDATGVAVGSAADQWFSNLLGIPCRMMQMTVGANRPVITRRGGQFGDEMAYADECPLLLISEASLEDLNGRLAQPIPMRQFRPNLVIAGCLPFEEDSWRRIQIGSVEFEVTQTCKRCVFSTIDPVTRESHPQQEPLRTMATFRQRPGGGVAFGVHLIPRGTGRIRLGDPVTLII